MGGASAADAAAIRAWVCSLVVWGPGQEVGGVEGSLEGRGDVGSIGLLTCIHTLVDVRQALSLLGAGGGGAPGVAGSPRGASILPRLSVKVRIDCWLCDRKAIAPIVHAFSCTKAHDDLQPSHNPYRTRTQQCRAALEALWQRRHEELRAEKAEGEVDFCRRMLACLDERLRSVFWGGWWVGDVGLIRD